MFGNKLVEWTKTNGRVGELVPTPNWTDEEIHIFVKHFTAKQNYPQISHVGFSDTTCTSEANGYTVLHVYLIYTLKIRCPSTLHGMVKRMQQCRLQITVQQKTLFSINSYGF